MWLRLVSACEKSCDPPCADNIISLLPVTPLSSMLYTLCRMRKIKERYGITDLRKHANRMTFGEVTYCAIN